MEKEQMEQNIVNYIRNVALYPRKSRGESELDLERHITVMEELCKKYNWNYIMYPEIGSGESIAGRPKMLELLRDVESDMFDAVVVMDYDRLGRGTGTDQDTIRYTFRDSETLIIEANPFNILNPNNENDDKIIDFKGFLANQEYKSTVKRLSSGRKFASKMGRWANGYPPYGYDYNRKKKALVFNEEKAEIFKEIIVKSYLKGESSNDIAWKLNNMKIPSPRNGLWSSNTILNMLKSEVYLGHIVFNKSQGVRDSQKKSISKKPYKKISKNEWITVKNCHPPLITQEDFNKVQDIISKRKSGNGDKGVNALSGIVKCYYCASTMSIQKNENGNLSIKKCSSCKKTKGGEASIVETTIITSALTMKEKLLTLKVADDSQREKQEIMKEIEKMENKLNAHEIAILKIEEAYEEGLYSVESTREKLQNRRNSIYELEANITRAKERLDSFKLISNKERVKRIDDFLKDIEENKDTKKINKSYKKIIESIIWRREKTDEVEVTVNFL